MWTSSSPQYYEASVKEVEIIFCVLNFNMQNWGWYEYSWALTSKNTKRNLGVGGELVSNLENFTKDSFWSAPDEALRRVEKEKFFLKTTKKNIFFFKKIKKNFCQHDKDKVNLTSQTAMVAKGNIKKIENFLERKISSFAYTWKYSSSYLPSLLLLLLFFIMSTTSSFTLARHLSYVVPFCFSFFIVVLGNDEMCHK